MNKISKVRPALEELGGFLFLIFILLLFSPLIIPILLFAGPLIAYESLWTKIRKDPKANLWIAEIADSATIEYLNNDETIKKFEKMCDIISKKTKAKQSDTKKIENNNPKFKPLKEIDCEMHLERTLKTEHATIIFNFDYFLHSSNGKIEVYPDDDECCGSWPNIYTEVVEPNFHVKRNFELATPESIWVVIALLRGDVRFTHREGQLWAYIPEHNVWLVQYKPGGDFGRRGEFQNKVAHKYGRDK